MICATITIMTVTENQPVGLSPAGRLLEDAGRALYGDEWVGPMIRALDVDPRIFRRWINGQRYLASDHAVVRRVLMLLEQHRDACEKVAAKVRDL